MINKDQAISELISLVNSADNRQDLSSKIFDKLLEMTLADAGFLMLVEDNLLALQLARGLPPNIWRKPPLKINEDLPGKVVRQGQAQVLNNLTAQEKSSYLFSRRYESAILLPLLAHGECLGLLTFFSLDKEIFAGEKLNDLKDICQAVAISLSSIRNNQLANSTKKHQKEIKVLTDVLKGFSHSFDFSEMLYASLAVVASYANCQKSAFARYDKKEKGLIVKFPTFGLTSYQADKLKVAYDEKIGGQAFCRGTIQIANHLDAEHQAYLKKAQLGDIKSLLALPLKSRSQSLGVIYLFSEKEDNFLSQDEENLTKIGSLIATAISQAEMIAQAQVEKNKAEAVLSSIGEGILAIDKDKKIIFINHFLADLLGIKEDNFSGKPIEELLKIDDIDNRKDLHQIIQRTLNFDEVINIPLKISLKNKNRNIPIEVKTTPLKDHHGAISGAIISLKDQSKELALQERQKTLLAITAHELRNPITGIKGYLELALSGDTGKINHQTKEVLEEAKAVTDHLAHLIEDILYVSQIEEEKVVIRKQKFDLTALTTEVLRNFKKRFQEKKLSLSHNLAEPVFVKADAEKTKEILSNLIDNALKYTSKGEIKLAISKVGNFIETSVSDSGIGLMPDQIKNLFTKFFRIITPETKNIPGTGLGLWITKHLVEKQGGKIAVISGKGEGSTFKFTLPNSDLS